MVKLGEVYWDGTAAHLKVEGGWKVLHQETATCDEDGIVDYELVFNVMKDNGNESGDN